MTTLSKILLIVAVAGLTGGSLINFHGVTSNPSLAAVLPLGAIAFGLFLIVFMMEKEMAKYDQEQVNKSQQLQNRATPEKISTPQPANIPAVALENNGLELAEENKVLVPIDFSDSSRKALQYAIHFAKQIRGSIILLHVLPPYNATDEGYEEESAQRLRAWANEFVPNEISIQTQTRHGAEAIEIVNEARKLAVNLMVISTHGRTGRAHALAGSLAENLVQLAPCPVLVVRENEYDFIRTTPETDVKQTSALAAPLV